MQLSHSFAALPSNIQDSLQDLVGFILKSINDTNNHNTFASIESNLLTEFMNTLKESYAEILTQYDIDTTSFICDGKKYNKSIRSSKTYMTIAGKVEIERTMYRETNHHTSICPMELNAGIIEKFWTPNAAKNALFMTVHLSPYTGAKAFKQLGLMAPSKSSLDRLPKKLSDCWEINKRNNEQLLREKQDKPNNTALITVSLDGVLIPIQGNKVIPGDSRYQEASCAAISHYDKKGKLQKVRRYANMPEFKKKTLKEFITHEVQHILSCKPSVNVIKLADGSRDNWS